MKKVDMMFRYVLYEITDDYDVIIKLSFENHTYLNAFIEQHTADKKYTPKFLVMELNAEGDIDFLSEFVGTRQNYRKCLAEFIE